MADRAASRAAYATISFAIINVKGPKCACVSTHVHITRLIRANPPSKHTPCPAACPPRFPNAWRLHCTQALRNQKHQPEKKGPSVVTYAEGSLGETPALDVVICGGTLGLFLATALQTRGFKVGLANCCSSLLCEGTGPFAPLAAEQGARVAGGCSACCVLAHALCSACTPRWRAAVRDGGPPWRMQVAIVEKRLVAGRNQEWNISRAELAVLTELGLMTPAELESCIVSEFNPIRVGFLGGEVSQQAHLHACSGG